MESGNETTPAQAVADVNAEHAKIFNALKGYYQSPLDNESLLSLPHLGGSSSLGYRTASQQYHCRMDEAFSGLSGYRRILDDIVIYDSDEKLHDLHVLQRCVERSITLSGNMQNRRLTLLGSSYQQTGVVSMEQLLRLYPTFLPRQVDQTCNPPWD